jgi:hypothetical protein
MAQFRSSVGEINGPSDLSTLKTGQLLTLYNELSNEAVKRFADRSTALKRCEKALSKWKAQQKDAGPVPEIATSKLKSYRPDSNRGTIIELASKAGGASIGLLMQETGWERAEVLAAVARIESYNKLTVTKTGEGDELVITVAGVLRVRKPFEFKPKKTVRNVMPGKKRDRVLNMLRRREGATFDEIKTEIKWNDRTTYEGIRLIHGYLGYGLRETPDGKIFAYTQEDLANAA